MFTSKTSHYYNFTYAAQIIEECLKVRENPRLRHLLNQVKSVEEKVKNILVYNALQETGEIYPASSKLYQEKLNQQARESYKESLVHVYKYLEEFIASLEEIRSSHLMNVKINGSRIRQLPEKLRELFKELVKCFDMMFLQIKSHNRKFSSTVSYDNEKYLPDVKLGSDEKELFSGEDPWRYLINILNGVYYSFSIMYHPLNGCRFEIRDEMFLKGMDRLLREDADIRVINPPMLPNLNQTNCSSISSLHYSPVWGFTLSSPTTKVEQSYSSPTIRNPMELRFFFNALFEEIRSNFIYEVCLPRHRTIGLRILEDTKVECNDPYFGLVQFPDRKSASLWFIQYYEGLYPSMNINQGCIMLMRSSDPGREAPSRLPIADQKPNEEIVGELCDFLKKELNLHHEDIISYLPQVYHFIQSVSFYLSKTEMEISNTEMEISDLDFYYLAEAEMKKSNIDSYFIQFYDILHSMFIRKILGPHIEHKLELSLNQKNNEYHSILKNIVIESIEKERSNLPESQYKNALLRLKNNIDGMTSYFTLETMIENWNDEERQNNLSINFKKQPYLIRLMTRYEICPLQFELLSMIFLLKINQLFFILYNSQQPEELSIANPVNQLHIIIKNTAETCSAITILEKLCKKMCDEHEKISKQTSPRFFKKVWHLLDAEKANENFSAEFNDIFRNLKPGLVNLLYESIFKLSTLIQTVEAYLKSKLEENAGKEKGKGKERIIVKVKEMVKEKVKEKIKEKGKEKEKEKEKEEEEEEVPKYFTFQKK